MVFAFPTERYDLKPAKAASAKRLTEANLVALGPHQLAQLLLELSGGQPAIKRRLRMELAAAVGPQDLAQEIDKRLDALATSKARVSWRKRGEFLTELDALRVMIAERLSGMDIDLALDRALSFLALAPDLAYRVKDPKNEMAAIFDRAAAPVGQLLAQVQRPAQEIAELWAGMIEQDLGRWSRWIDEAAKGAPAAAAQATLAHLAAPTGRRLAERSLIIRRLADVAGDVDAYIAAVQQNERSEPAVGAAIATRLLAAGRAAEAAEALKASDPRTSPKKRLWGASVVDALDANFEWESAYIESLDQLDPGEAQTARWASFERSLSAERLRQIVSRLDDFDDVEATDRAFSHAARHPDAMKALTFLMDWPALPEAARMIADRADEVRGSPALLEGWAQRLRLRQPAAARLLLLAAAKAAAREGRPLEAVEALRLEAAEIG